MHGQHSEDTQEKQHMRSGPIQRSNRSIEADSACLKSFFKAGRKVFIGDTALFQAGNSLPFIGIIRKVRLNEGALKLSVNWLYRPVDVKLGKGASLEAAPNEIFYSFHKDEISAESLLHPCKVAFLPKGRELPGVSSFVCWRVYDTSNKCLYWLTDQDYTDERQREVNQLLDKTKHEMQSAAQSEKPSQRGTSEATSAKPEAANVVTAGQGKTKKRERTDQNPDPSKVERLKKVEDHEPKQVPMSFEDFAAMAEKEGGLSNSSYVEQLIQVMTQERGEAGKKPPEPYTRKSLLAGIIVATEREDSLSEFVRLGGLRLLDDWLQEAHKGKHGEGSPNESAEGIEELLLSLLRALERLPVDLDALKTCSVGKSVNNLRSHRNHEVQRKARKLVDTWKKRVNAEMKSSDEAKSGSTTWSSKPTLETHVSKGGVGAIISKSSGSLQVVMNGSGPSEDTIGSGYKEHPESVVSKENSAKTSGASEVMAVVKEEKSCSSGQSHSNTPSWCGGSGKGAGLEEKAVSVVSAGNKTSGTALRSHSKTGSIATPASHHREPTGRHKTPGPDKTTSASLPDKRAGDGTRAETHTSQRLIVRLPNPGRSPAHSTSGGCMPDGGASNNRGSSPSVMDRPESLNESSRAPDIHSPGTSGDTKCGSSIPHNTKAGADSKEEGDRPFMAVAHDVDNKTLDAKNRSKSLAMVKCPSFSHMAMSMKGSVRSVVSSTAGQGKVIPEGLGIGSVEGIDLLASIAACEGSEKDFNDTVGGECGPAPTHGHIDSTSKENKEGKDQKEVGSTCAEHAPVSESTKLACDIRGVIMSTSADITQEEMAIDCATNVDCRVERAEVTTILEKRDEAADGREDGSSEVKVHEHESSVMLSADVVNGSTVKGECHTSGLDNTTVLQEGSEDGGRGSSRMSSPSRLPSTCAKVMDSGLDFYEEDALEVARQVAKEVEQEVEQYSKPDTDEAILVSPPKVVSPPKAASEDSSQDNETLPGERGVTASILHDGAVVEARNGTRMESEAPSSPPSLCPKDDVKVMLGSECDLDPGAVKEAEEEEHIKCSVAMESNSIMPALSPKASLDDAGTVSSDRTCGTKDIAERPVFDLNEGLLTDEALHDHPTQETVSAAGPAVVPDSVLPLAAPVAVVSATKGAFIPPSNISKPKGELGWKGSAATSAFRPAEPRRMVDVVQHALDTRAMISENMASFEQNGKQARVLDIDLNVADERVVEDSQMALGMAAHLVGNGGAAGSRPELDLNRVDESDESTCPVTSVSKGPDNSRLSLTASRSMLDFDLNDGPGSEEGGIEEVTSRGKGLDGSGLPVVTMPRPNSEFVSAYPWFSSTSPVPAAMVMPATLGVNRPDVSFPGLASTSVKPGHTFNQFTGGQYRAGPPVSSSSLPYNSAIPATFPPAGFAFGAGFPFTSASYSMNSAPYVASPSSVPFPSMSPAQLISAGAVVSPFGRPSHPGSIGEVPMAAADPSPHWARPSLDLNAGPDVIVGPDARDDRHNMRPAAGLSQFPYQQITSTGGSMKRKEPEGGFDSYRSGFTQMAWREL